VIILIQTGDDLMNIAFKNVQQRKLGDQVIQQLQEKISLGELKPGDKIPTEAELMSMFGVGRSTIREAVRVLVNAGLLEVRQGDGTYVLDRTKRYKGTVLSYPCEP
jgi:GntR family transcriptional regulator, transcriptional repressor for pyruvate dehydrogenase complex